MQVTCAQIKNIPTKKAKSPFIESKKPFIFHKRLLCFFISDSICLTNLIFHCHICMTVGSSHPFDPQIDNVCNCCICSAFSENTRLRQL